MENEIIMEIVVTHKEVGKLTDSLEIGTAGKGGVIKVYGDFTDVEGFKAKIDNAVKLRAFANEKVTNGNP